MISARRRVLLQNFDLIQAAPVHPSTRMGISAPIFAPSRPTAASGQSIENNRIFNCAFGCYHDAYSTKDLIIRNNYFSAVNTAIYQKMGSVSGGGAWSG